MTYKLCTPARPVTLFTSYHVYRPITMSTVSVLPPLTGDAARMLSDHPELTLATLKEKNSEDPRKFGLALGNMRYLLAEVLKGIAYMHSLHVVHRDVKASNILVRFHCQHENLLWCTCPHKYTVCVCDFDAAVEMDEEDKMLPISSTNQVR